MKHEIKYQGARFYKCALQLNPFSYAKFQGKTPMDEKSYNQQVLEQCKKNDIEVVGLADHGQVESSKGLREHLRNGGITVFPGFEIASSEKIHMVCLYPEETEDAALNQYLGQLMGESSSKLKAKPTHSSSKSCQEIAKMVLNEQDGFWFAAHATVKNGILRLSGAGDNFVDLWKEEELVIAVQIPGKVEGLDMSEEDLRKYREIIDNKNKNYKRKKPIAVINAKDIEKPADLANDSASCRIKMTEPSFISFRQAFYDPQSRIGLNHNIPESTHSAILSIKWEGAGFFENAELAFSEGLNALIGGRGTGKSALIESLAFVLGEDSSKRKEDQNNVDSLRKYALEDSQVIVKIRSKAQNGAHYTIERRFGESPVVKNKNGEISNLKPKDLLPKIYILRQNEILEIEKDEKAKLELLNYFLPDSVPFNENLAELRKKLADNRRKLLHHQEEFDSLDASVGEEQGYLEKSKNFDKFGITDKLKNVDSLEKEKHIQRQIDEQFRELKEWLDAYPGLADLSFLKAEHSEKLPNAKIIKKIESIFVGLREKMDALHKQASQFIQKAEKDEQKERQNWQREIEKINTELDQAIAKLPEQAGKTGKEIGKAYTDIIRKLAEIKTKKGRHKNYKQLIETLEKEREKYLDEYRDTAFKRFDDMNDAVKKLNKKLESKLKISLARAKNREELKDFLLKIGGIGAAKIEWLEEVEELDLKDWSEWVKEKSSQKFLDKYKKYGLSKNTAENLISMDREQRLELQEIELKDKVEIKLNTAHTGSPPNYVALDKLSTGQKCTAILNLLLLDRDDPLIIDQPEDNLDNAFIAERIVNDIRQSKLQRQFLFATHNANIPVFGDAELIAVLSGTSDKGSIHDQGSIDKKSIQRQAAEILEGGKAAFNTRKEKYGF